MGGLGYLARGGGLAADAASAGHTVPQTLAGGGGVVTDAANVEPAAAAHTAHTLMGVGGWGGGVGRGGERRDQSGPKVTHVVSIATNGAGDTQRAGVGLTATDPSTEGVEEVAAHTAANHLKQAVTT